MPAEPDQRIGQSRLADHVRAQTAGLTPRRAGGLPPRAPRDPSGDASGSRDPRVGAQSPRLEPGDEPALRLGGCRARGRGGEGAASRSCRSLGEHPWSRPRNGGTTPPSCRSRNWPSTSIPTGSTSGDISAIPSRPRPSQSAPTFPGSVVSAAGIPLVERPLDNLTALSYHRAVSADDFGILVSAKQADPHVTLRLAGRCQLSGIVVALRYENAGYAARAPPARGLGLGRREGSGRRSTAARARGSFTPSTCRRPRPRPPSSAASALTPSASSTSACASCGCSGSRCTSLDVEPYFFPFFFGALFRFFDPGLSGRTLARSA